MIFEALSTMKDVNGSDFVGILNFIKVRWWSLVIYLINPTSYALMFLPRLENLAVDIVLIYVLGSDKI